MSATDPRADAKLQNLPEEALQDLWRFRHPEEDGQKLTLEAIAAEVPRLYGFSVSLSSLHGFYRWLEVKRRIDQRADLVNQLKQDLAKDPETSEEQIRKAGQRLFMAEGILEKDHKIFSDMVKIGQNETKLRQNEARIGLDKRKLAIIEAKAARMDALENKVREIKAGGGLSAETLDVIEKQLKLL
jgi:hypothetical protein